MLVGLGHQAQVGKDTVARFLVEEDGFERLSFADALRDLAGMIDPILSAHFQWKTRFSTALEVLGYEQAKATYPELRQFLQRLGVGCRDVFGEDIWMLQLERVLAAKDPAVHDLVITDVRYPNEARMVKLWHGKTVKVSRPGFVGANRHQSEHALASWRWDAELVNDGTLEDLGRKAGDLVAGLRLAAST